MFLYELSVDEGSRRQGIDSGVVEALVALAQQIGFTLAGAMGAVAADPATRHRLLRNAGAGGLQRATGAANRGDVAGAPRPATCAVLTILATYAGAPRNASLGWVQSARGCARRGFIDRPVVARRRSRMLLEHPPCQHGGRGGSLMLRQQPRPDGVNLKEKPHGIAADRLRPRLNRPTGPHRPDATRCRCSASAPTGPTLTAVSPVAASSRCSRQIPATWQTQAWRCSRRGAGRSRSPAGRSWCCRRVAQTGTRR
jgi:hypothetical protein